MADPGIKKARVSQEDLPDINVFLEGYLVRYRIASEDRNRTSHWSPLFLVKPGYTYVSGSTSIGKSADHINLIWDPVQIYKLGYSFSTDSQDIYYSETEPTGEIENESIWLDTSQATKSFYVWNSSEWQPVSSNFIRNAQEYDIWLRWDKGDGGDWFYAERIEGNSSIFIIPNTYFIDGVDQQSKPQTLTAEIFVKGQPITREKDLLKVYTIGPETI